MCLVKQQFVVLLEIIARPLNIKSEAIHCIYFSTVMPSKSDTQLNAKIYLKKNSETFQAIYAA